MNKTAQFRDLLRDKVLFAEFNNAEMEEFLDLLEEERYAAGDLIVKQDDQGDSMYILVSGLAKVQHQKNGRQIELATLQAGDFFGEIALIDEGPRSASVLALEPCVLLKITQAAVAALAGVYPGAAFKLLIAIGRIMVDRLRRANERYIDSLLFPIAGRE
jgi:CRP-like cAMP-binding protein